MTEDLSTRFRGMIEERRGGQSGGVLHNAAFAAWECLPKIWRNIQALFDALAATWSSGQTEEQIKQLKTLKRPMYSRVSVEVACVRLFRARKETIESDALVESIQWVATSRPSI
ncbi:MAG TPA: hypothetical protein VKI44_18455 [Acetobacteraceae bacterium]|nr:hypothetical protein [Acetobacteraceae bacterium]